MASLFVLEIRLLARERAAWVLVALFAASLTYGIWNGSQVAQHNRETATSLVENVETVHEKLGERIATQPMDPRELFRANFFAVLPPAPLAVLATGQSDLSPGHESVFVGKLNAPADSRSELENPSHLLAGRFDLAFVLVWLYPLFLLALVYDLMAGDRETGTLRLALSQGVAPFGWMARRAVARALPVLILALLATIVAGALSGSNETGTRLALALAVVLVYGLFWMALAAAVNTVSSSAASAATALGAGWVALVLVAPTLLNVAVETLHPTPSRPELVAVARQASSAAEKQARELVDSFYQEHPELAPPGKQANAYAQHLTVQEEVGKSIEPVQHKFDEQLKQQQSAIGRWRFVSPAIAIHEALTDLAGTGYWRHRAFRDQALAFKRQIYDFVSPKFHRWEAVTQKDYDAWPRFAFQEEPDDAWSSRVATGLAGILGLAIALGAWTRWNLRVARLGRMTT
jgi:ABC-2 type transport system permease protein